MLQYNILNPLHQAVLDNNLGAVKELVYKPDLINSKTECKKLFLKYLFSLPLCYAKVTPLHIAVMYNRGAIAKFLVETPGIDINAEGDRFENDNIYISTPLGIAIGHRYGQLVELLLSQPSIDVHVYHLEALKACIGNWHDDTNNDYLIKLIKLCEVRLIESFIRKRENNPNKYKKSASKHFGGVEKDLKISAAQFLLVNIKQILTIKTHPEYLHHEKALNQGRSFSGLNDIFSSIMATEKAIMSWQNSEQNPIHDQDQQVELAKVSNHSDNNNQENVELINDFHEAIITNKLDSVKTYLNAYSHLLNSLNVCKQINGYINDPRVTPLHLATLSKQTDMIKYLLTLDSINLNAKAYNCHPDLKKHLTPLSFAIYNSKIDVIEILLSNKINKIEVNLVDFLNLVSNLEETNGDKSIIRMINLVMQCEIKLIDWRIEVQKNKPDNDSTVNRMFKISKSDKIAALNFLLANLNVTNGILTIKENPFYPNFAKALNQGETKKIFNAIMKAELLIEKLTATLKNITYRDSCILETNYFMPTV